MQSLLSEQSSPYKKGQEYLKRNQMSLETAALSRSETPKNKLDVVCFKAKLALKYSGISCPPEVSVREARASPHETEGLLSEEWLDCNSSLFFCLLTELLWIFSSNNQLNHIKGWAMIINRKVRESLPWSWPHLFWYRPGCNWYTGHIQIIPYVYSHIFDCKIRSHLIVSSPGQM